jgi:Flp pilus assembly protein CpaB
MRRTAYLVAFLVLAIAAGLLTLRAQRTVDVLVAAHDVRAGQQIAAGDVEIRRIHEDSVPGDALASPDAAVGQYAAWPFTGGEPVLARMVRHVRSGVALTANVTVPDGYRAIAVPVQPAGAVGGMLSPGDHVDVYATPLAGHQQSASVGPGAAATASGTGSTAAAASSGAAVRASGSGAASPPASDGTVLLGSDLLVLQLRSDQGQPLDAAGDQSVHGLNFGVGKLGSVVIAVPADEVARYASAAVGDSIYLALSVG